MNKATIVTLALGIIGATAFVIHGQQESGQFAASTLKKPVSNRGEQPGLTTSSKVAAHHQAGPAPVAESSHQAQAEEAETLAKESPVDQVLDDQLGDALAAFNSKMSDISRADVEEQREQITALKEQAQKYQPAEPREEIITDKFGNKMKKLTYDSGEVRYMFL